METVIASAQALGPLLRGEAAGTRFAAASTDESAFKLWLRYGKATASSVLIDAGAARAITEQGRSLLAVGVTSWTRDFRAGDGIDICHPDATVIARGISSVDAKDIEARPAGVEVVHRDKLAVIAGPRAVPYVLADCGRFGSGARCPCAATEEDDDGGIDDARGSGWDRSSSTSGRTS